MQGDLRVPLRVDTSLVLPQSGFGVRDDASQAYRPYQRVPRGGCEGA